MDKIHVSKFDGGAHYFFYCPGCKMHHAPNHTWEFNGDLVKPTFSPSILVNGSHPDKRCHSFVRNGSIEYLSDCFHTLAGKTIELPDFEGFGQGGED